MLFIPVLANKYTRPIHLFANKSPQNGQGIGDVGGGEVDRGNGKGF